MAVVVLGRQRGEGISHKLLVGSEDVCRWFKWHKVYYGYFVKFCMKKTFFFLILKSFIGIILGTVRITNVKFGSNQRRYVCATSDTKWSAWKKWPQSDKCNFVGWCDRCITKASLELLGCMRQICHKVQWSILMMICVVPTTKCTQCLIRMVFVRLLAWVMC